MSQLAQNDDGDIAVGNNKFSLVNGQDEIRQRLIQNLKTFLEEWFLDVTIGLPYLQLIFVKSTPEVVIADFFKNEILNTKGVVELSRFAPLNLENNRDLNVDFEVVTSASEDAIRIQEELP